VIYVPKVHFMQVGACLVSQEGIILGEAEIPEYPIQPFSLYFNGL
jgi:hypothetical protein